MDLDYDWFDDDLDNKGRSSKSIIGHENYKAGATFHTLESQAASIPHHHQIYAHFELELENFLCRHYKISSKNQNLILRKYPLNKIL